MNGNWNTREYLIIVVAMLIVLSMGFIWGYFEGYDACFEDAGIKKIIEHYEVD